MGRTSNGSELGQWSSSSSSSSSSYNQQWGVSTISASVTTGDPQERDVAENAESSLPVTYALHQNNPNPFNPETKISYQLPEAGKVKLETFDILGRKVRTLIDGEASAGSHDIQWDAADDAGNRVASGVYLYRIKVVSSTKVFAESRKMLLIK